MFFYSQFFQSLYQVFRDCTERTDYNWYHRHFHVPLFFMFSGKVQVLISLFAFFQFYYIVCRDGKVNYSASSLLCIDYH